MTQIPGCTNGGARSGSSSVAAKGAHRGVTQDQGVPRLHASVLPYMSHEKRSKRPGPAVTAIPSVRRECAGEGLDDTRPIDLQVRAARQLGNDAATRRWILRRMKRLRRVVRSSRPNTHRRGLSIDDRAGCARAQAELAGRSRAGGGRSGCCGVALGSGAPITPGDAVDLRVTSWAPIWRSVMTSLSSRKLSGKRSLVE